MNFNQIFSTKKFFIFNLVLFGAIFGFSLAFVSFYGLIPGSRVRAQGNPPIDVPQEALNIAVGLQTAFNAVSEKVMPSVMEIKTVSITRGRTPGFNNSPWDFFFGPRDNQDRGDSQTQEREFRSTGLGSGFIVRQEGNVYYVVTNNHVIDGATEIRVASRDGREYDATLVGRDSRRDIAIVSFRTNDYFPLAVLGNSDDVKVGDWSLAMGNPLGEQFSFSTTMGIISALGRTGGPGGNINDFIQTDAPINQGNSGGPLVNIRGEIIGINTWIASNNSGVNVGLGFAIPINNVKRTIDELIRTGVISDGWLGVSLVDLDRDMLTALNIDGMRGAFASQVFIGSPADLGGIRAGDFITAVDGREIRNSSALTQIVGNTRPGQTAVFTVMRDGASRDFTVRIDTRTDELAADSKNLWPGLMVVDLSDALRSSLGLEDDAQGLYVANVIAETPAAIIGIQRGDRITAINDIPVSDISAFYRVLRDNTSRELWFTFYRGESTLDSLRFRRP